MLNIRMLVTLALMATLVFPALLFADNPPVTEKPDAVAQKPNEAAQKPNEAAPKPSETPAAAETANVIKFSEYPAGYAPAENDQVAKETGPDEFIHAPDTTVIPGNGGAPGAGPSAEQANALDKEMLNPSTISDAGYKNLVEKNVRIFTGTIKSHFSLWLKRSGKYMSMMKDIFRENYLPEDLVFLALIESGFNPKAYSWAKASGPWQFIKGTAKKYGLKVDGWVDERRDPVKSTRAAAAYLKDLYGMFGTWPLAMASYNAGEGNVARAVNRNRTLDFSELIKTRSLPSETKEYVPKFMAAKLIAQNPDAYGFDSLEYDAPFEFDEVVLNKPTSLNSIAKCCGVPVDSIKELNPELIRWCTPPNKPSYTLRIPKGSKETFLANYAEMADTLQPPCEEYVVKHGDTLKKIAKKFNIPASTLKATNGIHRLKVGQRLTIPVAACTAVASAEDDDGPSVPRHKAKGAYYKVRRGDTLKSVARRHGMTAARLASLNGISPKSRVRAGQRLIVSVSRAKASRHASARGPKSHRAYRAKNRISRRGSALASAK